MSQLALAMAQSDSDTVVSLIRSTMPFQVVPQELLDSIVAITRVSSYDEGEVVYERGDVADDVYIVLSGKVEHALTPESRARDLLKAIEPGGMFGFAALIQRMPYRLAKTTCREKTKLICINGNQLLRLLESDRNTGDTVMSRLATMVSREFTIPGWFPGELPKQHRESAGLALTMFRLGQWLRSPRPYLMFIGFALVLGFWYLASEVWKLPRFRSMPGPTQVVTEWLSTDPTYGMSIYTPEYYVHIWASIRRVVIAFSIATALGVSLGLLMGWSKTFRGYVFPAFETLRPIPILAWVPLAILMFTGQETPIIYLTFLASFFATALNTMLGVQSIDESYVRAASCLGASRWQTFCHVIVPGALPYIFTGLQISVAMCWFSLVAAEMVSGQYGLGYVINTSYTMVRYPTIIIGMVTLGAVGYVTSGMVRIVGDYLTEWQVRERALGGEQ